MFDGQQMTKREVLIAREAFVAACRVCANEAPQWQWQAEQTAASRYPLPKVTRPRVVTFDNAAFRFHDGVIQKRHRNGFDAGHDVWAIAHLPATAALVRLWAELLANPTEEVEDDS